MLELQKHMPNHMAVMCLSKIHAKPYNYNQSHKPEHETKHTPVNKVSAIQEKLDHEGMSERYSLYHPHK